MYPFGSGNTIRDRFVAFQAANNAAIERAREQAAWVMPRMFSDNTGYPASYPTTVAELYSGKTARNVRQLAGKLGNAIYPPNGVPFFALAEPADMDRLEQGLPDGYTIDQFLESLTKVENYVIDRLMGSNLRGVLYQGIEHLSVAGDVLLYQDDDDKFRIYRMDQYVVRKGAEGDNKEIICRDWVETDLLPSELKALNEGKPKDQYNSRWEPLYTRLLWNMESEVWDVTREFRDTTYEKDVSYKELPYYQLSWQVIYGESTGRSLVEENFGDIRSLETLSAAEIDGAAALSQGLTFVDPTGLTDIEDIENRRPWAHVSARDQDFGFKTPARDIGPHLGALRAAIIAREKAIDDAFMVNTATQLTGERVTATQVVAGMQEIDDSLGGVLTNIGKHLQRPVVLRTIRNGIKRGDLDKSILDILDQNLATLEVKTGLDALGRQADTARIRAVLGDIAPIVQVDPSVLDNIDLDSTVRDIVRLSGLPTDRYTRDTQEVQQVRAQRQNAQIAQQAIQKGIDTAGNVIEKQVNQ